MNESSFGLIVERYSAPHNEFNSADVTKSTDNRRRNGSCLDSNHCNAFRDPIAIPRSSEFFRPIFERMQTWNRCADGAIGDVKYSDVPGRDHRAALWAALSVHG